MNFSDYLEQQKTSLLVQLFQEQWCCQVIFRSLKPVGQQIIYRLIIFKKPIKGKHLTSLMSNPKVKNSTLEVKLGIEQLQKLHILEILGPKEAEEFVLNSIFQDTFYSALKSMECTPLQESAKEFPGIDFLDEHAKKKWKKILSVLIRPELTSSDKPLLDLLVYTKLLQNNSESNSYSITKEGRQFALKDKSSQLWTLLQSYIEAKETELQKRNILVGLFRLTFLSFGKGYFIEGIDEQTIKDLNDIGLIYTHDNTLYPTRYISALVSNSGSINEGEEGFIIVETNMNVYVYNCTIEHIIILDWFSELNIRLPGFIAGEIKRKTIFEALKKGITAEQIISYLVNNVHKVCKSRLPPIPDTVCDMIRIWERERSILNPRNVVMISGFDQARGERIKKYASEKEILVCGDFSEIVVYDIAFHLEIIASL